METKIEYDLERLGIRNIDPDELHQNIDELIKQGNEVSENTGLFTVMTASQWLDQAKTRPIPKQLFNEFWFEGEVCILFADTNLGKSILAVQIGDSISRGENIQGFKCEASPQIILYCDFELSAKQFETRYSINYSNHYTFNDRFFRVEINPDAEIQDGQSFEEMLYSSLEQSIIERNAKILIIDNLTYLKSETERAKDALPLMKHLKALKAKYNLSILALAHTPKRDLSKPITKNDLQGSKMLINFCDSSFTIGESATDSSVRYIKQIKTRNTENIYDTGNVIVCQIEKPYNFLQFEFMGFGTEAEHLKQHAEKDKDEQIEKVIELKEQGASLRKIGEQLNISHMKVNRIIKEYNKIKL